jgi:hypothetical protein
VVAELTEGGKDGTDLKILFMVEPNPSNKGTEFGLLLITPGLVVVFAVGTIVPEPENEDVNGAITAGEEGFISPIEVDKVSLGIEGVEGGVVYIEK